MSGNGGGGVTTATEVQCRRQKCGDDDGGEAGTAISYMKDRKVGINRAPGQEL